MALALPGLSLSVPSRELFGGKPFKIAPELMHLGDQLVEQHTPRFNVVNNFSLDYLWRARGGTRRGEPVLADVLKPGGLTLHYSGADFVIVFSANHLEGMGLGEKEWAALMFEQLSKIGARESTGAPELLPFDFAGFTAELALYGAWREDLKAMARTVTAQPGLF